MFSMYLDRKTTSNIVAPINKKKLYVKIKALNQRNLLMSPCKIVNIVSKMGYYPI